MLNALTIYQNVDGGFGHALEADAWNPNSSLIQTWTATEILREVNFTDKSHPIIIGILQYLKAGKDFEGKFWFNTIKSNNEYPHAPWWYTQRDSTRNNDYNPTACLAGFIIRFADKGSDLYNIGCRIAREAFEQLASSDRENGMHTITCYIRLMQYINEAGERKIIDLPALKAILREQVKNSITANIEEWKTSYICKPSQFFNTKNSIFYTDNEEIAEYECEFITQTQLDNGSWNITWNWNDYLVEWAISKNWWKSYVISNILYIRGLDKI